MDVENLFYSVPHGVLFESVRECIDENGAVGFQNWADQSVFRTDDPNVPKELLNSWAMLLPRCRGCNFCSHVIPVAQHICLDELN